MKKKILGIVLTFLVAITLSAQKYEVEFCSTPDDGYCTLCNYPATYGCNVNLCEECWGQCPCY